MKKIYEKPVMLAERFVPNHYVAACPDPDTYVTYKFNCDAGITNHYHEVYLETNGRTGLQTHGSISQGYAADEFRTSYYHPCGQKHSVTVPKGTSIDNIFPYGYVIVEHQSGWTTTYETVPVRIWKGEDGNNTHCTTTLNASEYTPQKNLS